jgi:UDP-N-acetylmuramate: L-alanyl-gamma-D-glutamyl-meso-diaminopimelate ligase
MKVHFIAIGGSVMHQLAIALHRKGYHVSGSDDEIFEPARGALEAEGLLPQTLGWHPGKITTDLDAVILGMHARNDNPELVHAEALGVKIYSFPAYIYEESRNKTRIVVGGSHGKTTTTAMIMHVLKNSGKDFDYLVGAKLEGFNQSVLISDAPVIVCEGDEYPASALEKRPKFHFLFPHIAIITGIAWDHINVFPTFDFYLQQFSIYIDKIEPGGVLIYNETDPVLKKLVEEHPSTVRKIGYSIPENQIRNGVTHIMLNGSGGSLQVFGNHNLLNMHAAWLACAELGISAPEFLEAIKSFGGASKRLEKIAGNDQLTVFRDFAHAPSKVKATIDAVKQQFPAKKLVAVLELHTYSSLNALFLSEYGEAMEMADVAAVFYSRHALSLKKLPDLSIEDIQSGFRKPGLKVMNDRKELENWLLQQDYNESTLVLMSSGNYDGLDIITFAKELADKMKKEPVHGHTAMN